ncbi:MAG TPA: hypothetical protein VIM11_02825 [Tepidisphaeraceae bacterium]|jgi:hypothetical protein
MSATPPAIQDLARQLLAVEPARVGSSDDQVTQAARACERLRVPLTKLTGSAGFSSLISRALALAKRRVPSLDGLRVEADGSLTVSNERPHAVATIEPALDGGVILVAELLDLLITLIGEPLTLSLIREAWADVSIANLTLGTKDK